MSEFLMRPKVDFAFKQIMQNQRARVGFLSAVLKLPPEDIRETQIVDPHLNKLHKGDKLGILDVRVCLNDDTEIDIEIQLAPFSAWTKRVLFYLATRFLNAEEKEEIDMLSKKSPYIEAACETLRVISQDEQKQMEYLAREKAIRDHNQLMLEARQSALRDYEQILLARDKTIGNYEQIVLAKDKAISVYEQMMLAKDKAISDYEQTMLEIQEQIGQLKIEMQQQSDQLKLEAQRNEQRGIEAMILDGIEENFSKEKILLKLQRRFALTEEQANQYYIMVTLG